MDRAKATSAKSPISYCRICSNPKPSEKGTGEWSFFTAGQDGENERLVDTIRRRVYQRSSDDLVVIAYVLRLGLHADVARLRTEVYETIDYMSRFSDGIFMFCGV